MNVRSVVSRAAWCLLALAASASLGAAAPPRALEPGKLPADERLGALKDLNGYFPLHVPGSPEAWSKRADEVRRRVLVACGLWPMPTKTPLNPVLHGKVELEDYTIEKAYFESFPGFFVTGSLYRPKGATGKLPAVLCPHGHWANGRFHDAGEARAKTDLEKGAERLVSAARSPLQARCVQLARLGCVVFHYDMVGYADSQQIGSGVVHGFSKQQPDKNTAASWLFYGPQAELRAQNTFGLQTYNSIRALDFLTSLPDVDPARIGVTGASGGGTQTFILGAIDPRPAVAFPAVMVSTAMQGGCTCENASLLRIGTGNIELAGLFAPKPLAMSAADDWTKELLAKGYPELRQLYSLLNAPDKVAAQYWAFPHNYNHPARMFMYQWFNKHLGLNRDATLEERDFAFQTAKDLTVWDDQHPRPPAGEEFERKLLAWWDADSRKQLAALAPADYRTVVGGAMDTLFGRNLLEAGQLDWENRFEKDHGSYLEFAGPLTSKRFGEQLPTIFLQPKKWNKQVVVWLTATGKAGLYDAAGALRPAAQKLLAAGTAIAAPDLFLQGEFLADGQPPKETRVVDNPREFAGYTHGYNDSLFAQRVRDAVSVVSYIRHDMHKPEQVHLVAFDAAAPIAAAAAAQAREALDRVALDTAGFRFAKLTSYRDPAFVPGIVKYGDLPALLALTAPRALWLAGEKELPAEAKAQYGPAASGVQLHTGPAADAEAAAIDWLTK